MREDVAAILFDEPLTVIDPHLKWLLRRKLKEVHTRFHHTLVYVTHDQNEALTFAEKVVVMYEGEVVQLGTPQELFERPDHRFVGYFIGSPGMNFLPCRLDGERCPHRRDRRGHWASTGTRRRTSPDASWSSASGRSSWASPAAPDGSTLPAKVERVEDLGNYKLVTARLGSHAVKAKLPRTPRSRARARISASGRRAPCSTPTAAWSAEGGGMNKTQNNAAWLLVLPVFVLVAFSAIIPLMTVVNYSVQDIFGPGQRVFVGTEWFEEVLSDSRLHGRACCGSSCSPAWCC